MAFDLDDEELEATRRLPCNQQKYNSVEFRVKNLQRLINCGYLELNRNEVETIEYLVQRHEKLKKVETKLEGKNISVETLLAEFERLENIEFELDKEKEKNKELEIKLMEQDLFIDGLKEDRRIAAEEIQEQYYISKDKIKEILKKDRDCMSLGYYSAYIGLIDDIQELLYEE